VPSSEAAVSRCSLLLAATSRGGGNFAVQYMTRLQTAVAAPLGILEDGARVSIHARYMHIKADIRALWQESHSVSHPLRSYARASASDHSKVSSDCFRCCASAAGLPTRQPAHVSSRPQNSQFKAHFHPQGSTAMSTA